MKYRYNNLRFIVLFLTISLVFISCNRPPKEKIREDFKGITKINPRTNLPRVEWEVTKAAGYRIEKVYKKEGKTLVEIELKKPYYGKKYVRMHYKLENDKNWKWLGYEFFKP